MKTVDKRLQKTTTSTTTSNKRRDSLKINYELERLRTEYGRDLLVSFSIVQFLFRFLVSISISDSVSVSVLDVDKISTGSE